MTVFFDTNILLDILDDKRECHGVALTLLAAAKKGVYKAFVTTQSIIDASYIRTQHQKVSVENFRSAISLLSGVLSVESVNALDLSMANRSDIPDYEDAAQLACAERSGSDYILTRDRKYLGFTDIPVYSPHEFYAKLFR